MPSPLAIVGGALLLTLAIFAPLLRSGTVFFLDYGDYPAGPHPHLPGSVWGLSPGLTSRAPVTALLVGIFRASDWGPLRLLPFVLVPLLAAWGFARLFDQRPLPTLSATLFYVVNPFMYDRMQAGQVYLVVGISLLPMLVSLLWGRDQGSVHQAIAGGLLLSLLIALAPNFLFIAGALILVRAISAALGGRFRVLLGAVITLVISAMVSLYWVIPALAATGELQRITRTDLGLFRTTGDPRLGLAANVAGLYGFWRQEWPLAKDNLVGWPLFLIAILFVVAIGLAAAWRSRRARPVAVGLAIAGLAGFLLALGQRGPAGSVFVWMFDHVPEFRIMREPQKFLALLALAYAFFFGHGVESLARGAATRRARMMLVAILLLLPSVYAFRMYWGFNGYVRPSQLPASWAEADRIMGVGDGKALALPWHLYERLGFAQGRVVANPMSSSFRREVISGDNAEYGSLQTQTSNPRSRYIQFLLANGEGIDRFGSLVAPLDVKYVLLASVADWKAYAWVYRQQDLRLVHAWPDLALFENLEPVGRAFAPTEPLSVADWGEVIGLAQHHRLTDFAITVRAPGPGPIVDPGIHPSSPARIVPLRRADPARYQVLAPASPYLVFTEPYDPGWRYEGARPLSAMGVTNLFRTDRASGGTVAYRPWLQVRAAYVASTIAFLLALTVLVFLRVRAGR